MSKTKSPLGSNSVELFKTLTEQISEVDKRPKNFMYDNDTLFSMLNFNPAAIHPVRIIDDDTVNFDGKLPYTEIIKSEESDYYCFSYALVYKGKLVALGEEQGYCGGITCNLTKESNPKKIIKLLNEFDANSRLLYEKIKDMEIATPEELPKYPKLIYRVSDNNGNTYYLNDNTDRTYTLWRVNDEEYNGVELITSSYLGTIKQSLSVAIATDIDKVISKTNGDK